MPAIARIPFEGVLNCWNDEHDLPDLLLAISRSGKTGRLTFSNPEGDKTVFIKDGRIVFAESSSEDDGLGQYLLRTGRVSLTDYVRISKLVQPGKRLGALLVEHGILEPRDLVPAVKGQVRAIILGLFRRTETWYGFKEEASRKESITLDLPVDQLVLEGVRYVESWRRVSKGVGDLDDTYRANPDARDAWSKLRLPETMRELLTMLESDRSLAEICTHATLADFDACRYLWAFRCLGWIQIVEATARDPKEAAAEPGSSSAEERETPTLIAKPPAPPAIESGDAPVLELAEAAAAPQPAPSSPPPSVPEIEIEPDAEPTLVSARRGSPTGAGSVPEIELAPAPDSLPEVAAPETPAPPSPLPATSTGAEAADPAHTQIFQANPAPSAPSAKDTERHVASAGEMMEAIFDEDPSLPGPVRAAPAPAPEPASTQLFSGKSALPQGDAKTPAPAPAPEPASTQLFSGKSALPQGDAKKPAPAPAPEPASTQLFSGKSALPQEDAKKPAPAPAPEPASTQLFSGKSALPQGDAKTPAPTPAPEPASTQLFSGKSALPERDAKPTPAARTTSPAAAEPEPASTQFFKGRSAMEGSSPTPAPAEESYADFLSMEDSAVGFEALVSEPPPAANPAAEPTPEAVPDPAEAARKAERALHSFSDLEIPSEVVDKRDPATPPSPPPAPLDTVIAEVVEGADEDADPSIPLLDAVLDEDRAAPASSPAPPTASAPPARPSPPAREHGGLESFVPDEEDPFSSSDIFAIEDIVNPGKQSAPPKKSPEPPGDPNQTKLDVGSLSNKKS